MYPLLFPPFQLCQIWRTDATVGGKGFFFFQNKNNLRFATDQCSVDHDCFIVCDYWNQQASEYQGLFEQFI